MILESTKTTDMPKKNIKRIGAYGPAYEVMVPKQNGNKSVRIRIIETGEELDYPYSEMLADPEAK